MKMKGLTICIFLMLFLVCFSSLPVKSIKIEKNSKGLKNNFFHEDLERHGIYYFDDSFLTSNNDPGYHRIIREPPWSSDYETHKDILGIGDAWKEQTDIDGTSGKSILHTWAGPGAGRAGIDLSLIHYGYFTPPVDSVYTFKFTYKMVGEISLSSCTGLIGSSAARGFVTFCYNLEDSIDKDVNVFDVMSIGGFNNGVFPYSITKSYSEDIGLIKGKRYTFWVTGLASAVSDGFVEVFGMADHHVFNASLVKVEIEWPNHPPETPKDPKPANGDSNIETNTFISWKCNDPDGSIDTLKYDVYFGTDSTPDSSELISKSQTDRYCNLPEKLEHNKKYYWKIIARDSIGDEKSSPVWSFTTKKSPKINFRLFPIQLIEKIILNYSI